MCADTLSQVQHEFWAKFVPATCCTEFKLLNFMGHDAASELCVRRHDHRTLGWPVGGSVLPIWVINGVVAVFVFRLVAVVSQALCTPQNCISLNGEISIRVWLTIIDRITQLVFFDRPSTDRRLLSTKKWPVHCLCFWHSRSYHCCLNDGTCPCKIYRDVTATFSCMCASLNPLRESCLCYTSQLRDRTPDVYRLWICRRYMLQ